MNRAELTHMLDTEPATPNQRGAIIRECDRLGLDDRAERLATLAQLLGLETLTATGELTSGQAGTLVRLLTAARNRADLPGGQDHADDTRHIPATLRIALMTAMTTYGINPTPDTRTGKPFPQGSQG